LDDLRMRRRGEWTSTHARRELDALEFIVRELERLRILKEHELGIELKEAPEGSGSYVPRVEK
jgi:hypothetical protein